MNITWDANKNRINCAKHKIDFATAALVFADPLARSEQDRIVAGEERWRTLGMAGGMVLILVAHTYSDTDGEETIRIISARKATKQERKLYEQAL